MSEIENPPAFPCEGEGFGNPNHHTPGMTLLDWFAGQALVGLLAAGANNNGEASERPLIATDAYAFAGAMLAARTNKGSAQ